jgi:hypothetical protein
MGSPSQPYVQSAFQPSTSDEEAEIKQETQENQQNAGCLHGPNRMEVTLHQGILFLRSLSSCRNKEVNKAKTAEDSPDFFDNVESNGER